MPGSRLVVKVISYQQHTNTLLPNAFRQPRIVTDIAPFLTAHLLLHTMSVVLFWGIKQMGQKLGRPCQLLSDPIWQIDI